MKKINVLKILENEKIKQNELPSEVANIYSGFKDVLKDVAEYSPGFNNKILEYRKANPKLYKSYKHLK